MRDVCCAIGGKMGFAYTGNNGGHTSIGGGGGDGGGAGTNGPIGGGVGGGKGVPLQWEEDGCCV